MKHATHQTSYLTCKGFMQLCQCEEKETKKESKSISKSTMEFRLLIQVRTKKSYFIFWQMVHSILTINYFNLTKPAKYMS